MLDSLEVVYIPMSSYSMRLHAVRLTEFLFIPRLRVLRIVVPGLYDEADAASFLGPIFMGQLRKCNLQEIDITLMTDQDGEIMFCSCSCVACQTTSPSTPASDCIPAPLRG